MPRKQKWIVIITLIVAILVITPLTIEYTILRYPELNISVSNAKPIEVDCFTFNHTNRLPKRVNISVLTVNESGYKNTTVCSDMMEWAEYNYFPECSLQRSVHFITSICVKGELPSNLKTNSITIGSTWIVEGSAFRIFNTKQPGYPYTCGYYYLMSTFGRPYHETNVSYNLFNPHDFNEKYKTNYTQSSSICEKLYNRANSTQKYFNFSELEEFGTCFPLPYINCTAPLKEINSVTIQGGMKSTLQLQNIFDLQEVKYE